MSKSEEKKPEDNAISRRKYLQVAGGTIAGLVVGGAIGYVAKPTVMAPLTGLTTTETVTVSGTAPPPAASATATLPPVSFDFYHSTEGWNGFFQTLWGDYIKKYAPNLTMTCVPFRGTEVYVPMILNRLGTADPPALFCWWAGQYMKGLPEGKLLDLSPLWEKHSDEYDIESVRPWFSDPSGKFIAAPLSSSEWPIIYDKVIFQKYGWQVPTTWDEFTTLCDTIIKTQPSIIPILFCGGDTWTGWHWYEELIIRTAGPTWYDDLCYGKHKYSDPESLNVFKIWADLINKGYYGKGEDVLTYTYPDVPPRIMPHNRFAMFLSGDWVIGTLMAAGMDPSTVGCFMLPPVNASVGNVYIIEPNVPPCAGKGLPPTSEQQQFNCLDYVLSAEGQLAWAKQCKLPTMNKKVSQDDMNKILPLPIADLQKVLHDENYKPVLRMWENSPTDIVVKTSVTLNEMYGKGADYTKVAKECDAIADAYWAAHPS